MGREVRMVSMFYPPSCPCKTSYLTIHDCRSTDESCPIVKFADDTELVGKISSDEDAVYHKQTENFVNVIKVTCI